MGVTAILSAVTIAVPVLQHGSNLSIRTPPSKNQGDRGSSSGNSEGSSSPPTSGMDEPKSAKPEHQKGKATADLNVQQGKGSKDDNYKEFVSI